MRWGVILHWAWVLPSCLGVFHSCRHHWQLQTWSTGDRAGSCGDSPPASRCIVSVACWYVEVIADVWICPFSVFFAIFPIDLCRKEWSAVWPFFSLSHYKHFFSFNSLIFQLRGFTNVCGKVCYLVASSPVRLSPPAVALAETALPSLAKGQGSGEGGTQSGHLPGAMGVSYLAPCCLPQTKHIVHQYVQLRAKKKKKIPVRFKAKASW